MAHANIVEHQSHTGINWTTTVVMGIFHAASIAALFYFSWNALAITLFLWWLGGGFGIGMGYHRLRMHGGFRTPKPNLLECP